MEHWKGTVSGNPPNKKANTGFVHTAVLEGIAVFFYSTDFYRLPSPFPISPRKLQTGAPVLKRVRFSFVGKGRFLLLPLSCFQPSGSVPARCRGPPVNLVSSDFRLIGGTQHGS